jgi:hypothetical protein
VEKKPNATLVSDHSIDYDLNGNRSRDVTRKMNADNHGAVLTSTADYTYDPRYRVAAVTKTGDGARLGNVRARRQQPRHLPDRRRRQHHVQLRP